MEYNVTQFFVDASDRDRIQLSPEYWVEIKHEMSVGDHDRFNKTLFQYEARQQLNRKERREQQRKGNAGETDEAVQRANYQPSTALLLQINILDWNLVDSNGKSMSITIKTISSLTQQVASILEDEIGERNPTNPLTGTSPDNGTKGETS